MTRNTSYCIAFCAGLLVGCFPPSEITGDLLPPVSGRLAVTIAGLPADIPARVSITSAQGFSRTLTVSETLSLPPGAYLVTAPEVPVGEDRYGADRGAQNVVVDVGTAPAAAVVLYSAITGRLHVAVDSVPPGAAAQVVVTGPNGYARTLADSATLSGLAPGLYSIAAARVELSGDFFDPDPLSQAVQVTPLGTAATAAAVKFARSTGRIALTVSGLPGGTDGAVQVTGPSGFNRAVTASTTLTGLDPGTYTVTAAPVTSAGNTYQPSPGSGTVQVTTSNKPEQVTVAYALGTGSLQVVVTGLPVGTNASVSVIGPQGFSTVVTSSTLLAGLVPGGYTITATGVQVAQSVYQPSPTTQSATIPASPTAQVRTVTYSAGSGSLAVTVAGLPAGTAAAVGVTGPGGFSQNLTGSQTLTGLVAGGYMVSGQSVASGGTTYNPSAAQLVAVVAGSTASGSITYAAAGGGGSLNLRIDGVYLTQATQTYAGTVPLVAGRDAYLRAFAWANQSNAAQPLVRVRLYSGSTLVQTHLIPAPLAGVPTSVNEGALASSWNVLVPGSLVQPGLRVLADIDPANGIGEGDETDNQFPLSGGSVAIDVRTLPVFSIRFVPVLQQTNGLQGNVTDASKDAFLSRARAMLPIGAYTSDVRAVYTTTAPVLESGNGNGAWGTILSEVLALRNADATNRYYFGVVKTGYGSGVVGMGYVGGSARTAIGWDVMSNAPSTVAHELGHNMGRSHAPCGGVGGADPSFPYAGGLIGVSGLDVSTLTIKTTSVADLMGYCSPTWISDYSWNGAIAYRQGGPNNAPQAMVSGTGLLVWGRITGSGIVLEPGFRVAARADLLPVAGPNLLELFAADGRTLRTVRFDAAEVADLPGGAEQHFAFVIPLDTPTEQALAGFRVQSGSRTTSRAPSPLTASSDPALTLARDGRDQVQLRWNAARYPMVLVRDLQTGEVLSFARGGSARLWARNRDFELTFSDGVKSVTRAARILQ